MSVGSRDVGGRTSRGRQHSHKVKVTPREEALLLARAETAHVTVPRLLVESALSAGSGETATERRNLITELFRTVRLLASISNNVNQMAIPRSRAATGWPV